MCSPLFAELPPAPEGRAGWMWKEGSEQLLQGGEGSRAFPKITIVTPSFNQGEFLEETIRSVLLQGYPNLEYIIIDGGSTDDSVEIIKRYAPWLAYWVSEQDRGQTHAINKGFARSTGDIHAYLNSDDWYEPGALLRCAQEFEAGNPWVVGQVQCWQESLGCRPFPKLPGKSFTRWLLSCPIAQAGSFWSSQLHREVGDFREDLNYVMDYEFWLRFRFIKRIEPRTLDQQVAVFRLHGDAKSIAQDSSFAAEISDVVEHYEKVLSRRERLRLWSARQHRAARKRGTRAVSLLLSGKVMGALGELAKAVKAWPLVVLDVVGVFLAIKELARGKQEAPVLPEIWPE